MPDVRHHIKIEKTKLMMKTLKQFFLKLNCMESSDDDSSFDDLSETLEIYDIDGQNEYSSSRKNVLSNKRKIKHLSKNDIKCKNFTTKIIMNLNKIFE